MIHVKKICEKKNVKSFPTQFQYDGGAFELIANGTGSKDNYLTLDFPPQDGYITIYTSCSKCDHITPTDKVWFKVYFKDENIEKIEHQDILIHGTNSYMTNFVQSDRISYNRDLVILSFYIDSSNMKYAGSDSYLKCYVPPRTPKATISQSPSQSPTVSPTFDTTSLFINKNYTTSLPNDPCVSNKQVQITPNSNIRQISGCTFTDITDTNQRNYYMQATKEILFFDNVFQNTEYSETERAGIMWVNYNGAITIQNCKFIRLVTRGDDAHVFNSNNLNRIEYNFEGCEFIDCGKNDHKALVNALHNEATINFYDCKFIFNNLQNSCRVIDLKSYNAKFERCYFTQCGTNAIYLGCPDKNDPVESTYGTFTFKDNNVNKCNKGLFIRADKLRNKPIIEGNTFEDISLSNSYMISISHDQNEIIFNNNTFSQITTSGNENSECGGAGIFVPSSSTDYTIKYIKCNFISITNNHENNPNNHGGAIQVGFTNITNANIEINECEFRNNVVKGGHGGGVALRTNKNVLIQGCIFDANTANHEGQTDGSKGFGGAIYISASNEQNECISSVTISGCTISNNKGYQGYGIYLQGNQECQSNILINNQNIFDNNQGTVTHPNSGCIIASELININKADIEGSNDFTNLESLNKFLYVDQLGNPLPDATETPSLSPEATDIPTRTFVPGTTDAYINKQFEALPDSPCIDSSGAGRQIQAGTNEVKQISGCTFTDISNTQRAYYIKSNSEILFYDNAFKNTVYSTTEGAGILWMNYNGKMTITNCKFINLVSRGNDGHIFNVNNNNKIQLIIERCEFIDCGKSGDRALINMLQVQCSIEFYECNITFNNIANSCRVIDHRSHMATFERCRFTQCGENSINLGYTNNVNPDISAYGTFIFCDNIVNRCNKGCFIRAPKLESKPTIERNIFEEITHDNKYMISITYNQNEIEFNNNTFSRIKTSSNCGGIGILIANSNDDCTIKYTKCIFDSNEALESHGGSICYGYSSSSNANIEIIESKFRANKVSGGHGGGIAIRTNKAVNIRNCQFEANIANSQGDTNGDKGFGGAIYISTSFDSQCMMSVSISGCTFNDNLAYQGYSIYLQGSTTACNTIITINNNNQFNNDHETETHPQIGSIIASEITTIDIEAIEKSNGFTNTNDEIRHIILVDTIGNPLPDPTETPTSVPETPTSVPNTPTSVPETPTPDLPTFVEDIIFDDSNYTENEPNRTRIEKVIEKDDTSSIAITVKKSAFTGIENDNGGAIHIENCGLKTDGTVFTECKSKSGGGGAIFVENTGDSINNVLFNGLTFIRCKAEYGGGAYVYSSSTTNKVEIGSCEFIINEATNDESEGGIFGGSAIYLATKKARIRKCTFENNDVKVHQNFASSLKSRILPFSESLLTLSDCHFKIDENMMFSLYYFGGNGATQMQLESCTFYGKLKDGAYFIDGKLANKNSPKLIIKSCRFSSKSNKALNQNGQFASINLKDQFFEFDQFEEKSANKKMSAKLISIIVASVVAVVAILVVTMVILVKKRTNPNVYSYAQDGLEMSSQSRDISETSLVTPLI